jgi:oxalate decarboxylase/phosphoglucose isomerase-like protein (cupin superfamily)
MPTRYQLQRDAEDLVRYESLHGGKGHVDIKFVFRSERVAEPALILVYNIPPGASEGMHSHEAGDDELGPVDEFYYVIEGRGEMQLAAEHLPVSAGDHVFAPAGVSHGIVNTSDTLLKVYLVAMMRGECATAHHLPGA